MPTSLSATSSYLSHSGRTTSVMNKGYMYDPGTDCTWELLAPVQFLTKENSVYHPCMHWLRPLSRFGPLLYLFVVCD